MKTISLILVVLIAAFTAKPLLNHYVHAELAKQEVAHECCGHCDGSCCGDKSDTACDTSADACSEDCTCMMDGIVVFTQTPSPQIVLFETMLEKIETRYFSYEFSLPPTIWHPPKNVSMSQ